MSLRSIAATARYSEGALRFLQKWLQKNPTAAPGDRAVAENLIHDLHDALKITQRPKPTIRCM